MGFAGMEGRMQSALDSVAVAEEAVTCHVSAQYPEGGGY